MPSNIRSAIKKHGETLKELENAFRFNDAVIRNLVMRQDKALTEASPLASLPPSHPSVKSVQASIRSTNAQIREELRRIAATARANSAGPSTPSNGMLAPSATKARVGAFMFRQPSRLIAHERDCL